MRASTFSPLTEIKEIPAEFDRYEKKRRTLIHLQFGESYDWRSKSPSKWSIMENHRHHVPFLTILKNIWQNMDHS